MPKIEPTDYRTHPDFNPDAELTAAYEAAIQSLQAAFAKDSPDKTPLLERARQTVAQFSPERCRQRFGLGSGFSLAKEFFVETFATSAAAVARIHEQAGRAEDAKLFLLELYRKAFAAGFTRDREFLANRIDSRTFMPMRRHVNAEYLRAAGYRHPDRALLCVGDCQTLIEAEMIRQALPLRGIDIAAYQHSLGSLIDSPLEGLFNPVGYFFFVNCAADYALIGKSFAAREKFLDIPRRIVEWLKVRQPRISVFVTHVYFGVDNAVEFCGTPRNVAMDAVGGFSDAVAAILAQAPNVTLVNFQQLCPFTLDKAVFRDQPEQPAMLHFQFEVMDRVAEKVVEAMKRLESQLPRTEPGVCS